MGDPRRESDEARQPRTTGGAENAGDAKQGNAGEKGRSKTAGTNRDFDESGESRNQGHGHPREERGVKN